MKKYLVGMIAIVLAFSATAFTKIENAKKANLYWYHRTGLNTYVADGFGASGNTPCPGGAVICDKGFLTSQVAGNIKDNTMANQQVNQGN